MKKRIDYIYIALDVLKPTLAKIGFTSRKPESRIAETTNPHYLLYTYYEIPDDLGQKFEKLVHKKIENMGYSRLYHESGKRQSEWFEISPEKADDITVFLINEHLKIKHQVLTKLKTQKLEQKIKETNEKLTKEFTKDFDAKYLSKLSKLTSRLEELNSEKQSSIKNARKKHSDVVKEWHLDRLTIPNLSGWNRHFFSLLCMFFTMALGVALFMSHVFDSGLMGVFGGYISFCGLTNFFILYEDIKILNEEAFFRESAEIEQEYKHLILPIKRKVDGLNRYKKYLTNFDYYHKKKPMDIFQFASTEKHSSLQLDLPIKK